MSAEPGKPSERQGGSDKARWLYRFDNFSRAFVLLREAIASMDERELSQLELEGIIQRYEYTWELAWNSLRDYLDYIGIIPASISPRAVIRAAFEAGVISRGDDWMDALDVRNKMSHTYNLQAFEQAIVDIRARFLDLLDSLYQMLMDASLNRDEQR